MRTLLVIPRTTLSSSLAISCLITLTWSHRLFVSCLAQIPGSHTTGDLRGCVSHLCYYPTSTLSWPRRLLALKMYNMCSFPCWVQLHWNSKKWEMLQKKCAVLDLWALLLGQWPWVNSSPVNQSKETSCIILRTSGSMSFPCLECLSIFLWSPTRSLRCRPGTISVRHLSHPHLSISSSP